MALHRSTSKPTISRVFGSGAANGGTSAKVPQRSSLRCMMSCSWSACGRDRLAPQTSDGGGGKRESVEWMHGELLE